MWWHICHCWLDNGKVKPCSSMMRKKCLQKTQQAKQRFQLIDVFPALLSLPHVALVRGFIQQGTGCR